jgi:hypothetical protein
LVQSGNDLVSHVLVDIAHGIFLERTRRNALPLGEGSPVGDGCIDAGLAC